MRAKISGCRAFFRGLLGKRGELLEAMTRLSMPY